MNKLISVIIPIYNTEKYLRKCLDGVCNQTLQDIEIICINDCSTDSSLGILQEYATKDSRIKVINNEVNMKAALTRNVGLDNAVGDYIYFIDADDYIDSDYLQQMYDCAIRYDADIVMNTNILTVRGDSVGKYVHPLIPCFSSKGGFIDNVTAIDKSFCVVWMRLFKRKLLVAHNIRFVDLNVRHDIIFNYIVNLYSHKTYCFFGSAYHYTIRDDSLSGIVEMENKRDLKIMMAYNIIYDYLFIHSLLDSNQAKIFSVFPFFKVDSKEKFDFYKKYFVKVQAYLSAHKDQYNAMDWFFAESILSSKDFDDYRSKYPASVALAFLRKGRK